MPYYLVVLIDLIGIGVLTVGIFLMACKMVDSILIYIPFIATRRKAIKTIIKELELREGSVLYDLGCGDGLILGKAINNTPGAKGVGIEKGIVPFLLAKFKTRKLPIKILCGDIFLSDLSEATHIYCYLHFSVMDKLEKKIRNECKKGIRIVVNDYPFKTLRPQKSIPMQKDGSPLSSTIYVYTLD